MTYPQPRANLDLDKLNKLCEDLVDFTLQDALYFNERSGLNRWEEAKTVRLCPNTKANTNGRNHSDEQVLKILDRVNSLNQENISWLAYRMHGCPVELAYTFVLPPPPPKGGGG